MSHLRQSTTCTRPATNTHTHISPPLRPFMQTNIEVVLLKMHASISNDLIDRQIHTHVGSLETAVAQ